MMRRPWVFLVIVSLLVLATPRMYGQSCSGVTVTLGTTDIQAVVDANPEGTTFCFQSGTYLPAAAVQAKSSDRFIGVSGTVLDGNNTITRGIWGTGSEAGQRYVTVQGIKFVNFTDTAVVMGWNWTVSSNEMTTNKIGVTVNGYSTLSGNNIHHNTQYGVTGGPGADMMILNNEVAWNNTGNSCAGACIGDAGGSKIVGSSTGTTGLLWRNNTVHDNLGHGIWSDANVYGTYENNTVYNNSGSGIFHEISWAAIIRNNHVRNNVRDNIAQSCWWGSNILLNTSANVEIYGNTVLGSNGSNGICIVAADRSEVAPYPVDAANNNVHDNFVYMTSSATTGMVKGDCNMSTECSGNAFAKNTYFVTDLTLQWWTWPTDTTATWSEWQGLGQDSAGLRAGWVANARLSVR